MIDGALPYLRCPVCEDTLAWDGEQALRCPRRHSFDIAKHGYATLTRGRMPHAGDSAEMVAARAEFLAAGHYAFLLAALRSAVPEVAGPVVDAGTGTGWYLAGVLDARPGAVGIGLDVSKPALRRAARAHPRAAAVLADLWQPVPLGDSSAAVILNVFAPRNGPEFHRILRADGVLVVATPATDHLRELVESYRLIRVDPGKADRIAEALGDRFRVERTSTHRATLDLTGAELRTLIGMTPSARHLDPARLPIEDRTVTAAVDLTVYRPA
jgi:23S rRNA (guanine745-N1)-methyltransferase